MELQISDELMKKLKEKHPNKPVDCSVVEVVLKNIGGPFLAILEGDTCRYVDEEVAVGFGTTLGELVGQPVERVIERFVDPEEVPRFAEMFQRRMNGENGFKDYELKGRNGSLWDVRSDLTWFRGKPFTVMFLAPKPSPQCAEEAISVSASSGT